MQVFAWGSFRCAYAVLGILDVTAFQEKLADLSGFGLISLWLEMGSWVTFN